MHTAPTSHQLAEVLPGSWRIRATNTQLWLDGRRTDPVITYAVASPSPLLLNDIEEFDAPDGKRKAIRGKSRLSKGAFSWRGSGFFAAHAGRWRVTGIAADSNIVVVSYFKTRIVPSGISVLVRDGVVVDELRTAIARNAASFGLGPEDFATLSWLK
jgi:hypothetical protein